MGLADLPQIPGAHNCAVGNPREGRNAPVGISRQEVERLLAEERQRVKQLVSSEVKTALSKQAIPRQSSVTPGMQYINSPAGLSSASPMHSSLVYERSPFAHLQPQSPAIKRQRSMMDPREQYRQVGHGVAAGLTLKCQNCWESPETSHSDYK